MNLVHALSISHGRAKAFDKTITDLFTFYHNFDSSQVKSNNIVIARNEMYELPHDFPNNLKLII